MNADGPQMNAVTPEQLNVWSGIVVGAAYRISTTLGVGFLEKVYENALMVELRRSGLSTQQQASVRVKYQGVIVGDYVPDLLVEHSLIVEVKSVPTLQRVHRLQCVNYLRATNLRLALLLNFGRPRVEVARIALNL